MTPDQRFQVLLWALGVVAALAGFGIRVMWRIASAIQRNQDAVDGLSQAVTEDRKATQENTRAISVLSERITRVESHRR